MLYASLKDIHDMQALVAELEHQLKATTTALNEHLGRSPDKPFAPPLDPSNNGG